MYSPAIINTEQAFHPLPFRSDRLNLVLPLHSFCEGNPFLVEILPCSGLGPIDLNASEQVGSQVLDTTLSPQTSPHPLVFWSTPNSLERS